MFFLQIADDFAARFPLTQCKLIHKFGLIKDELKRVYQRDLLEDGLKQSLGDFFEKTDLSEGKVIIFICVSALYIILYR